MCSKKEDLQVSQERRITLLAVIYLPEIRVENKYCGWIVEWRRILIEFNFPVDFNFLPTTEKEMVAPFLVLFFQIYPRSW